MAIQSLEELKKENELENQETVQGEGQEEEVLKAETPEDETVTDEVPEEPEGEAEQEQEEEAESDEWMRAEEEPKFTDRDAGMIRRKYKAKIDEKQEEIEALRKEIQAIKEAKTAQAVQNAGDRPKRVDFDDEDDYIEALTDYKIKLARQQDQTAHYSEKVKRERQEQQEKVAKSVDEHYLRAAKLAEKSGIKPEAYQSADRKVREAVDSVFHEAGDAITDALIANIGEGSEKVFYHLGVNPAKRQHLVSLLEQDKTGLKAAAFLGRLSAQLSIPVKRTTSAPDPIDNVHGDKSGSVKSSALREKYLKAHKAGDIQAAFNIKRQAKSMKIDVSGWAA